MAKSALAKLTLVFSIFGLVMSAPSSAQVRQVDPNDVIGSVPDESELPSPEIPSVDVADDVTWPGDVQSQANSNAQGDVTQNDGAAQPVDPIGDAQRSTTYQQDDVIAAATGVFGKGAEGIASLVEDIFSKQGEPNGYIVGREGGAALVFGLRYGSGTLYHKVEGERPVYWNGPSIGFDAGANAASTFVLVYNLYDSEDLYRRYPAGEGAAYLVGGFNASYLRRGDVVLIPIRLGVGARLGVNAGYMKFRKKRKILPF